MAGHRWFRTGPMYVLILVLVFGGMRYEPPTERVVHAQTSSGDITAVNAGYGLSGGGQAGDVTLSANLFSTQWAGQTPGQYGNGFEVNNVTGNGLAGKSASPSDSGVYGENYGGGFGVAGRANGTAPAVLGDATSGGDGVQGVSVFGNGVQGFATNCYRGEPGCLTAGVAGVHYTDGAGVRGYSREGVGVSGGSGSGLAGDFGGTVRVDDVVKDYWLPRGPIPALASGSNSALPIAYGTFNSNGSRLSGTPNLSCRLASIQSGTIFHFYYQCTLEGVNYTANEYTTNVTPIGSIRDGLRTPMTDSVDGKLAVYILNSGGIGTPTRFQVLVFKA